MKRNILFAVLYILQCSIFAQGQYVPFVGPGGTPINRFQVVADWPLSETDSRWLDGYLPVKFEEARQNVNWAYDSESPTLSDKLFRVELHPSIFVGTEGRLIAGESAVPGTLEAVGLVPLRIQIAWDREMSTGLVLSHEFAHLIAFFTYRAGWEVFGHGTSDDPFLRKVLAIARRVYIPGHAYDPFKAGVN